MIQVCFCCNEEHGNFTGRVMRFEIDVTGDEFTLEELLWPPAGVALEISRDVAPDDAAEGADRTLIFDGTLRLAARGFADGAGNMLWSASLLPEGELLRLLNYLMHAPNWHCTCGPCDLYEYFNDKRFITSEIWQRACGVTA